MDDSDIHAGEMVASRARIKRHHLDNHTSLVKSVRLLPTSISVTRSR